MKIKLFTHNDLDGVGCAVVAKSAFKDVDVEYCGYENINERILSFLKTDDKPADYDRIFITDISVNEEVAEALDLVYRGGVSGVQLVDHHATALWLAEKYPNWCHVRTEESNLFPLLAEPPFDYSPREKVISSGTTLFYKFLRSKHLPNIETNQELKIFAENVRRFDSWEWYKVYSDDHPKRLNDLLYIVGINAFEKRFTARPLTTFTETELTLLETEEKRVDKYLKGKMKQVKFMPICLNNNDVYHVAYVYAEENQSILGNMIAEAHPKTDFAAIIDMGRKKVSLRGIHKEVDLGKDVASYFGGGGHPMASGFSFDAIQGEFAFNRIFNQRAEEV